MSLVGDILKAAAEKQQRLLDDQRTQLRQSFDDLAAKIKRPWKDRVESIGEAAKIVKEITSGEDKPQ